MNTDKLTTIQARASLEALKEDPTSLADLATLGRWCDEHGFEESAFALRKASEDPETPKLGLSPSGTRAIIGLRYLLTNSAWDEHVFDRYDVCCGVDENVIIPAGEIRSLTITPQIYIRFRRLFLGCFQGEDALDSCLSVSQITVGIRTLFGGMGQVSGRMFTMLAPEMFSCGVTPGTRITIHVENLSMTDLLITACALGDELPFASPTTLPTLSDLGTGERWRESILERVEKHLAADPHASTNVTRLNLLDEIRCEKRARGL